MKNFLTNYNWANWTLLIIFVVMLCIDLGKENYVSACSSGFVAIFNMFMIVVLYQRRIMTEQDEQKEREEKIIKMLKEKEEDEVETTKRCKTIGEVIVELDELDKYNKIVAEIKVENEKGE